MLELLHIENVAVIESADIQFLPGMNVLTGETGAGKSIIIDSLGALLGGKASRDLVRTGTSRACVTGVFAALSPTVQEALAAQGITPEEDSVILQREFSAEGRSVCRINSRPVALALLRQVGELLVSINGQHDSQQLLRESSHLDFVDRYAADADLLTAYRDAYRRFKGIEAEMSSLRIDEAEKERRIDMLRYQIRQLEEAKLREGEDEELEAKRKTVQHAQRLSDAASSADRWLNGGEDGEGALSQVKQTIAVLRSCANYSDEMADLGEELQSLCYDLEDVAERIADMRFAGDDAELDRIESRLDTLDKLRKRYGPTVADMLAHLSHAKEELDSMEYASDRLAQLEAERKTAGRAAVAAGRRLSERRREAAHALETQINAELAYLDMPRARFHVHFIPSEKPTLGKDGLDKLCFYISVNAGEEPKPLAKVASGGELSRVMLAIRNVLSDGDEVPTLIFDEVDAGLSGRAAGKVAEKLATLAASRQVMCVTHLSQLAAMADRQLRIRKTESDGRTFTLVEVLSEEGREQELARINNGEHITEIALAGAREMRRAAEEFKANRQENL
ncbi:MAG: DNA repair protein RecN [Ruminococcaceae bacterium]|nr:DNA repair protein RecN [Oscillospiraceae bacterium]